jgi:predicted component of type VI protein secretion system
MAEDAPSAVAVIDAQISSFLADARRTAADGLTWQEFGELLIALLHLVTDTLDRVNTLSGPDKKSIALTAVAALFDTTASRCVPLAAWPAWAFLRPVLRAFVMALASGAVESMLHIVRSK